MERTLDILGTPYKICVKKYDEDEAFENSSIDGYCDSYTKQIVVCEMTTYKGWENEPKDTFDDPYLAYAELEKAFTRMSGEIRKGVSMAQQSEEIIEKTASVFSANETCGK